MWLPVLGATSTNTNFLTSNKDNTLTIPSTARSPIAVGAYDSATNGLPAFSGRGGFRYLKPDIVAPGVNIILAAPGGGYASKSGTSMATPFVTGAAALLMEWGIVKGNDRYLYGEKVKAYLIKGARQLPGMTSPNPMTGFGALCLKNSMPV